MFLKIDKVKMHTDVFTKIYFNKLPTYMKSIKFEIVNHVNLKCYKRNTFTVHVLEPLYY